MTFALLLAFLAPASLDRVLLIHGSDGWCHAAPVGVIQVISAAHCVGSGEVEWRGQGKEGTARLMWRDDRRDVAMFAVQGDAPAWAIVPIAKEQPKDMDEVYWRALIPGCKSVSVRGQYLGIDEANDITIIGYVSPGSSGSPVLNAAGELVGVVKSAFNSFSLGQHITSTSQELEMLDAAINFSPAGAATPINSWPKP